MRPLTDEEQDVFSFGGARLEDIPEALLADVLAIETRLFRLTALGILGTLLQGYRIVEIE